MGRIWVFIAESLFTLPEVHDEDDDVLSEVIEFVHDDSALFVAGDPLDGVISEENGAAAIYA